ncbi:MAG: hypothetical protein ISR84_00310 [Kiritimatiellales bacterium]|nr:hypothetical protein [Kiritimatiellota bacterium]MBL7015978.1 hypothetical protein [Kiritimatiellales bacterium]
MITLILLIFSVSPARGAELDIQSAWAQPGLSAEERNALVAQAKNMPFAEIVPGLLKTRVTYQPDHYINPWGATPWNNDDLEPQDRAYLMAVEAWQHHMYPADDWSKASVLLNLLRQSSDKLEQSVLIGTMVNSQWYPDAEDVLLVMALNKEEDLEVRRAAASALLSRCEIDEYMPLACEIILLHERGLPRCRAFNLTTDKDYRLHSLSLQNKRLMTFTGFRILAELPRNNLNIGYFVARRLGYLLRLKDEFTPNKSGKYRDANGLTDAFFSDTVKNALQWYSKNKQELRDSDQFQERGIKALLQRFQ